MRFNVACCTALCLALSSDPMQACMGAERSPELAANPKKRVVSFTTEQFTRPYLDITNDGKTIYFDVLGEIFTVSASGGVAKRLELGPGWKQRPMLSPDGRKLAFQSDRSGPIGIWVKKLGSTDTPIPFDVRENADVISAAWVNSDEVMTSGRGLHDVAGYNLATSSGSGLRTISIENHMPGTSVHAASLAASKKSGRFVYYLRNGLKRLDRTTGSESDIRGLPPGASQLRLTTDEKQIAFIEATSYDDFHASPSLSLLDLTTGFVTHTHCTAELNYGVDGDGAVHASYAVTPDGSAIVVGQGGLIKRCEFDGATTIIPIAAKVKIEVTEPPPVVAREVGTQVRFPASNAASSKLAFVAGDRIWELDIHKGSINRLTSEDVLEYTPSYSPDGTRLAYIALENNGSSSLRIADVDTGKSSALLHTQNVLANPSWSPDSKRLTFVESPPNTESGVQVRWIDTSGNEQGTFAKDLYAFSNSNRYFPTPVWDRAGQGVFYASYKKDPSQRYFWHQNIGESATVLYDTDESIWEVSISPSGRYMAFMDASGIAVAPAVGTKPEQMVFVRDAVSNLKRVADTPVDYMTWLADDRLVWSIQDEIHISDSKFNESQMYRVKIPAIEEKRKSVRVAYIGADILTMTRAGLINDGVLVTNGSAIEYVGPFSEKVIQGAVAVDLSGKTIIPGMIDVHQHERQVNRDVMPYLNHRLFASAAYGVTTVFDPSYTDIDGSALRERSNRDDYPGATFYTSGAPILGQTPNPGFAKIDSYADALRFVSRKAKAGSIVIKDYLQPTRSQRRWLAEAAHANGLGITGHERNDIGTQMSMIVDGYSGLEHGLFGHSGQLYGDIRSFLVHSGISVTPTLGDSVGGRYFFATQPPDSQYFRCLAQNPDLKKLKSEEAEGMIESSFLNDPSFDTAKQYAQILNDGGHITIGAHFMLEGIGTHWEMWELEKAGATPMNVLKAATVYGALKLGLEKKIGALSEGFDADFVVLNSDPLTDIKNSADIYRVIRRGRMLEWPSQEQQPSTWTMQEDWKECSKWNLGVPRTEPYETH